MPDLSPPVDPALLIALVVGVGVAAQWIAARFKIPAILLLLLIGFLAGPVFGVFDPDAVFGDLLFPSVTVAVGVILFEGALTLRIADIRGAGTVVLRLITLGVAVTIAVVAVTTHLALGLGWWLAILFGTIVSVTGPTVIVPLLRAVRPSERISQVLKWEGILIDPIGAVLALLAFEATLAEFTAGPDNNTLLGLFYTLGLGTLIGGGAGYGLGLILKRHLIPDYLTMVTTLATVLVVQALANALAHESGLVAVTIMGILLGNLKDVPTDRILDFKESLSVLLISVLFIVLAARIDLETLRGLGPGLVLVLAAILFLARPLGVFLCTIGSDVTWPERALLAWLAPRGIIAAAISALFALRLQAEGMEDARLLVGLTFSTIVVTVVLQSLSARPLARLLGVAQPEARGVLIIGGNAAALAIAKALNDNKVPVMIADSSWAQVRAARMSNLRTFHGNPVSEQADRSIDLIGIGRLMAMSRRPSLNALACLRYRSEFGAGHVFTVRRDKTARDKENEPQTLELRGALLFDESMTLETLTERLEDGFTVRITGLTEDYGFDALVETAGGEANILFAITPDGGVRPFADQGSFKPAKGWKVGYLARPAEGAERKEKTASPREDADRPAPKSPSRLPG